MKPNAIDKLIGMFSPESQLRRLKARYALELYSAYIQKRSQLYEGAGGGRRWNGTTLSSASAETAVAGSVGRIRSRFRDLVRNNAHASRSVRTLASQIVGTGIIGHPRDERLRMEFMQWADSTQCDITSQLNFYGIQLLAVRSIVESGAVLIRRQRVSSRNSFVVPFKLQVLEPDFIDTSMDHLEGDVRIRRGIEFDDFNRPIAYHLFEEHPGGSVSLKGIRRRTIRVPANEIIHAFDVLRPGQIEGMPWGHPIMMRLRDYEDYEDAQLLRQKIAACFTGFIHDIEAPANQVTSDPTKPMSDKFEPGAWEVLPPGKDIKFAEPPGVGSDFEPYTRRVLQGIAAGMGVTYEQLTSDYSNVNYSSARMAQQQFQLDLDHWRYNMVIPQILSRIWDWFVEAGSINGIVTQTADKTIRWTPPKRFIVDPTKEVSALKDMVRSGFQSLSETVRQFGEDPDEHFDEMAADNQRLDRLQLKLDSDPRSITSAGQNQQSFMNDEGNNGSAQI